MFIAVLKILGSASVVMTSANINFGDHFNNSKRTFIAAQGGTEHARKGLRIANATSMDTSFFADELLGVSGGSELLIGYADRNFAQSNIETLLLYLNMGIQFYK